MSTTTTDHRPDRAGTAADRLDDPADVVTACYEALRRGDTVAAMEAMHPDAVVHVPGANPLSGDHHGAASVLGFAAATRSATIDGEHVEVRDVLRGTAHVALLCRVAARRPDGRVLENHTLHLVRPADDGRIAEVWLHNRDQAAVDAFWGDR